MHNRDAVAFRSGGHDGSNGRDRLESPQDDLGIGAAPDPEPVSFEGALLEERSVIGD